MQHSTLITSWSSWTPGCWLLRIVVSLALCSTQVGAAYAFGPVTMGLSDKITLQDGKLTAHIVRAPLRQVMEEVSRLSGAQVRWMDPHRGEREISVEFTDLPFSEALRRLLREENFMIYFAPTGQGTRLSQIWILSREKARDQPIRKEQPLPQAKTTPLAEQPAEVTEQPLDLAIETAMSDEDLSSRLRAIEDLGHYAQEDARARQILSGLVHNDSNPQVRDVASTALAGTE
jgi:hypothetical protein